MYIWRSNILYIWWCRYVVPTSRINKKKSIRCILGIMSCCPIWLSTKRICNSFLCVAVFHTELCESNIIHVYAVFIVFDHSELALFIYHSWRLLLSLFHYSSYDFVSFSSASSKPVVSFVWELGDPTGGRVQLMLTRKQHQTHCRHW